MKDTALARTVENHLRAYLAANDAANDDAPAGGLYGRVLQEVERPLLQMVMQRCKGNQLKAAALLGINRNTLRKKLRDHGLCARRNDG